MRNKFDKQLETLHVELIKWELSVRTQSPVR